MTAMSQVSSSNFGVELAEKLCFKPDFTHDFARHLSRKVEMRLRHELAGLGVNTSTHSQKIEDVAWGKLPIIMEKIEFYMMDTVNPCFAGIVVDIEEEKATSINSAFDEFFQEYLSEVDGPCELKYDFGLVSED